MVKKPLTRCNALVLCGHHSRESDLILHCLTAQDGKVPLFSRGTRGSKQKFNSRIDIFDYATFELRQGKGSMLIIQHVTPITSFKKIRESLDKISAATVLCEAADKLLVEGMPTEPAVLAGLVTALGEIEAADSLAGILRGWFTGLRELLGEGGFVDRELFAHGSVKRARSLLTEIAKISGKPLASAELFESLLNRFAQER